MLRMDYPYIKEEYFTDYATKATWNLLPYYIDTHSQSYIYEYLVDGVQDIKIFQPQCENMASSGKTDIIDCFIK